MTKKLFVSKEISFLLYKKGFNEPCLAKYTKWNKGDKKSDLYPESQNFHKGPYFNECQNSHYPNGMDDGIEKVAAPLYQQVIDWLQEKHDINVYTVRHGYEADSQWEWWADKSHSLKWFNTKYEALNEAIIDTLNELPDTEIIED